MLEQLRIRNLAVVEDAVIEFAKGLNVLTGSTGAGKSIILAAVELLSGGRAKRSMIRKGAEGLFIAGIFRVPHSLKHIRQMFGMDRDDDLLSIQREISVEGRSRIRINGIVSTASSARAATSSLLELHGQHGQQELLDPAKHVRFLDMSGGYDDLLKECNELSMLFRDSWKRLRELRTEQEDNRRKEEFLRFQLRELEDLKLESGIADKLEKRINMLENIRIYMSSLENASEHLTGERGAIDSAREAERMLESISGLDEKWKKMALEIASAVIILQETAREINIGQSDDGIEEESIEPLQEKLAAIQRVARKYGTDADGLVSERDRIREVLKRLDEGSDGIEEARAATARAKDLLEPVLDRLSEKRRKIAKRIDTEVTAELAELGMKGALFRTAVGTREIRAFMEESDELDLPDGGRDEVEFMIRTNVGEELHPLAEVASGGELSRITLVLKKLLVRERFIPTLIFDEIDTGLGADMGAVVAGKLSDLSGRYQVICITHLPQVAAAAVQHVSIIKTVSGGRTRTTAYELTGDQRMEEITRMLGGDGELRERLAEELLDHGESARSSAG